MGDSTIDITYDPCERLALAADPDASPDELAGIDEAAAMWNQLVGSHLGRDEPTDLALPIRFEDAAPLFHGIYRDELGDVVINRALHDPRERAITIAHELGHAFGLAHVDASDRPSVMNDGNLLIAPNPDDAGALAALWGRCGDLVRATLPRQ